MGKNKRPIEIKNTPYERKITYAKRHKGLLKKVFELSVLCDVDVALITYSTTGVLRQFSGKKKLERILQDYIKYLATIPEEEASDKPIISQNTIDKISMLVGHVDDEATDEQGIEAIDREEISEETVEYYSRLKSLQEQEKKLIPDLKTSKSIQEFEDRKRYLEEALQKIKEKKKNVLSRFNIGTSNDIMISQPNMQRGEQLQQGQRNVSFQEQLQQGDQNGSFHFQEQQFGVPSLIPQQLSEIPNDMWSLHHMVNPNLTQEMPAPAPAPVLDSNFTWLLQEADRFLQSDQEDAWHLG